MGRNSTTDDEALVRRIQSGDPEAFALIVRRWEEPVYQLAYRMLGRADLADEVRQLALLRMHRGLAEFNGDAHLATWIYRVVTNLCRDARRARDAERRRTQRLLFERRPSADARVDRFDESGEAEHVERAVLELPSEIRAILVLRHYQDMTFAEIAKVLDLPPTTVRSRALAGMKQLAAALGFLERGGATGTEGGRE